MDIVPNPRVSLAEIARFYTRVQWCAILLGVLAVIWVLGPVLTPFVVAAILGWMGDPLVDWLEARGRSRNTAVVLVFTLMVLLLILGLVILVPLIQRQIETLVQSWPTYQAWFMHTALPWFEQKSRINISQWLDFQHISELIRSNWERAGGFATTALAYVSRSGFALLGWAANLVLIPVLAFFFLRDWDVMVEKVAALVPRKYAPTVNKLASESNEVLGGFLRGQLLVMIGMGIFYAIGLALVGLNLGVLIGIIAGILTFVPFLGPAALVVFGTIVALVQYGDWKHLIGVGVVYGVGQLLESYVLTPKLVGDRIGLGPMAVIFAVIAGGQLFGFVGMLIALPVAAVANVLVRFAVERYRASNVYSGSEVDPGAGLVIATGVERVTASTGEGNGATGA